MRSSFISPAVLGLSLLVIANSGSRTNAQTPSGARGLRSPATAYVQPVRIELPSIGLVTFFDGSPERNVLTQSPSQVGLFVGRTYRFQISGMPEYPGAVLYPTVELIDRLHPPAGKEQDFPIPIPFTTTEIETALQDGFVTKVIYLESPQHAQPLLSDETIHVADLSPTANLVDAADQRGRAMAIIRLGGRTPSPHGVGNEEFFGELAPVITQTPTSRTAPMIGQSASPLGRDRQDARKSGDAPAVVSVRN